MSRSRVVCVLLVLITLLVYLPVRHYAFVNYDDEMYVTGNPMVQAGLTWPGVQWAFTATVGGNWHPLTWLSLMLDCQLFGVNAGGYHLVNVLLHAASAALLFILLLRLTGALWQSAFIAALFAWHPLHVESVAWIAERKDVLCAFFGLLALLAYARYAQKRSKVQSPEPGIKDGAPGSERKRPPTNLALDSRLSTLDYSLALFFFALSLMSKPMLVTLPFVFLLLDYWPLQRAPDFELRPARWFRLAWEKWPFFVLAAASCAVTFVAQRHNDAVFPLQTYPLSSRLGHAAVSYVEYLFKSVWPANLAVIYPLHGEVAWGKVAGAVLFLAVVTGLIWRVRRPCPYLFTGWFWYLGMLVPVIGLVQVGVQAIADRYMYLPLIGVSIGAVFGLGELAKRLRLRPGMMTLAGGIVLVGCLWGTARQLRYWRNSETLFEHAVAVTTDNPVAQGNLGSALDAACHLREAMEHFQESLRLHPDAKTYNNVGSALAQTGHLPEAMKYFEEALRLDPHFALARNNLGLALARTGHLPEAIEQFREALQFEPDYAPAHSNLGLVLAQTGQLPEAIQQFREALQFEPASAPAQSNLGKALLQTGQLPEAIQHFQQALRLQPGLPEALYDLGVALTQAGRPAEAVPRFEQALQLEPDNPAIYNGLGLALLNLGQAKQAVAQFRTALQLQPGLAAARDNLGIALFRQGQALFRDGQLSQALADLQESLQINPGNVEAQVDLAWAWATCPDASLRNGAQAVKLAQQANELSGGQNPAVLGTLAAADAEVGQFSEAAATARKALQLLGSSTNTAAANGLRAQIGCYEKGVPFRDHSLTNTPAAIQ